MTTHPDQPTRRGLPARLLDTELWIVLGGVALSVAEPRFTPVAVLLAALFWPLRWLATRKLWHGTPADWALVPVALAIPVSLWASADHTITIPVAWQLALGLLALYAVVHWSSTASRVHVVVILLALAGLGLALLTPLAVTDRTALLSIALRPLPALPVLIADGVNANIMAGVLVLLFPLPVALLLFAFSSLAWWERLLLLLVTGAVGGMVVLLTSRGALLALGVVMVVLIALRWQRLRWIVPLALVGGVAVIVAVGPTTILNQLAVGGDISSLSGRLEIWSRALYMLEDFPITGIGMGMFGTVADILYPFFLAPPGSIPHAHNLVLQVGVDLGLPGLIGWLATLFIVIAVTWRLYQFGRKSNDAIQAGIGAGLLLSQLAMLTHGLLDAPVWASRTADMAWLVWGVALAAWLVATKKNRAADAESTTLSEL
ncbi:MAG: O-antigen ligase family protein [Anaerolineae bacterium]|nr:O-antigen ligase family protein [Anaerolineae bacterium]